MLRVGRFAMLIRGLAPLCEYAERWHAALAMTLFVLGEQREEM